MRICDVTLGETGRLPDREYTADQRVEAGRAIDRLGVPFLGVGRPTDEATREAANRLADEVDADVVVSSSTRSDEVEAALEAGADVVEVSVPVSEAWLELRGLESRDAAFEAAETAVLRAREGGADVGLALEDAFRAEVPAIAGAFGRFDCSILLADTVGARTPPFVAGFLRTLADASADLTRAGVRFRDDLGCGTGNAIVAAETGIDRVDASVAGLGERAGLAATEELVTAIEAGRGDAGTVLGETVPACEDALRALGESVPEDKPVLGSTATALSVGDGGEWVLADPSAFAAFDPERFGGRRRFRFDGRTDRGTARLLLERADRDPGDDAVEALLERLAEEGPVELEAALELAADV